jgi:hypothetical protein
MGTAMPQLDPRQRSVFVNGARRQGQGHDVIVVPKRQERIGTVVRAWMDRAIFGADHAPAAFGLHPAQGGTRLRALPAEAGGVRGLVKAVGRRDRTNADRLEQYVVARVAGHRAILVE